MNKAEKAESSSRKGQENGDSTNESERPLKKARFAWQVKGKYHLKNDANDTAKTSTATSPDSDVAESSGSGSSNHNRGTEQNLEILGDYLLKQDFNTLDSVIVTPEQSLLTPSTSKANEKHSYPRNVSSYEQSLSNNGRVSSSERIIDMSTYTGPSPMVLRSLEEDTYINLWQSRQVLQMFVDNTINCVLEIWMQSSIPPEDSQTVALQIAQFINNQPGNNVVENEGILAAISAHGLRQSACSNSGNEVNDNNMNRNIPNSTDNVRPITPLLSDVEFNEQENNNNQCSTETSSNNLGMRWCYSNDSNGLGPLVLMHSTNLSYQGVNDSHPHSSAECDEIDDNVDNNHDVLDEAILFAIQNKGLTTSGSDYG